MTYAEKKMFFRIFVERVDIYEDYAANGQILKSIVFKIPLLYDNKEATEISWDKVGHVETVVLLSRKDVYERIKFDVNVEELMR